MEQDVELAGGRGTGGVVRRGAAVHRPTGPWTPTVHAFLRHLEERGYRGSPRVLGFDEQGREVLTFLEGVVPSSSSWERGHATELPPDALTDEALAEVGSLIRELHEASADFRPANAVWREHAYPLVSGEIVCHHDLGPHNTVYRDGRPIGFIDWDGARPNEPLLEVARAAWPFVPLADDVYCEEMGFVSPPDRGHRFRLFASACGVDAGRLVDVLHVAKHREAEHMRYWPLTAASSAVFLGHLVRELEWLAANEAELRAAR